MLKLHFEEIIETFQSTEELINRVKEYNENEIYNNRTIIAEREDGEFIEIVFRTDNETVLIYGSENLPDYKITCNDSIGRAKGEEFEIIDFSNEAIILSNSNLISIELGYEILKEFLNQDEFFHLSDWYSF